MIYISSNFGKYLILIFALIQVGKAYSQLPGQPPNSFVYGQSWYCKEGYQKSGNTCVSIFADFPNGQQPPNSFVYGQSWYCKEGYQKSGNTCVSIFADFPNGQQPPNSFVYGQSWYCKEGYQKSGNTCVSIFADFPNGQQPPNSFIYGQSWYCKEGYQKSGNTCVSIFADFPNGQQPPNSFVYGQSWYCKEGYKKFNNRCVNIFTDSSDIPSTAAASPPPTNVKEQSVISASGTTTYPDKSIEKTANNRNLPQASNSVNQKPKELKNEAKKKKQLDSQLPITNGNALSGSLPPLKGN